MYLHEVKPILATRMSSYARDIITMLYVMGDEHDANVDGGDGISVGVGIDVDIDISNGGRADYNDGSTGSGGCSSVALLKVKDLKP